MVSCQTGAQPPIVYQVHHILVNDNLGRPCRRRRLGQMRRAMGLYLWLVIVLPLAAEPYYLAPGQPDGVALLAPPPLPGSAEEAADLASARDVFKARTEAEQARAFKDASLSIFLFAPAIGPHFQPGQSGVPARSRRGQGGSGGLRPGKTGKTGLAFGRRSITFHRSRPGTWAAIV